MVNLLPDTSKRFLAAQYYSRLAVVCMFLSAIAIGIGAAFLVPPYLLAKEDADASARYLAASQRAVALGSQGGTAGVFAVLSERVAILKDYPHKAVVAPVLSAITNTLPAGISIQKFQITPLESGKGTVSFSGTALTRTGLLAFVKTLQDNPLFQNVTVPVNDLATETNVAFMLSFSFSVQP